MSSKQAIRRRRRTLDRCPLEPRHKITYLSLAAAWRACFDGMQPYLCREFPHFHVGHSRRRMTRSMEARVGG